jgi:hypothetical protein
MNLKIEEIHDPEARGAVDRGIEVAAIRRSRGQAAVNGARVIAEMLLGLTRQEHDDAYRLAKVPRTDTARDERIRVSVDRAAARWPQRLACAAVAGFVVGLVLSLGQGIPWAWAAGGGAIIAAALYGALEASLARACTTSGKGAPPTVKGFCALVLSIALGAGALVALVGTMVAGRADPWALGGLVAATIAFCALPVVVPVAALAREVHALEADRNEEWTAKRTLLVTQALQRGLLNEEGVGLLHGLGHMDEAYDAAERYGRGEARRQPEPAPHRAPASARTTVAARRLPGGPR